jgi:hypothetical protein
LRLVRRGGRKEKKEITRAKAPSRKGILFAASPPRWTQKKTAAADPQIFWFCPRINQRYFSFKICVNYFLLSEF